METSLTDLLPLPEDAQSATKFLLGYILNKIQPFIRRIRNVLRSYSDDNEIITRAQDVYSLCASQISKCLMNLFEIFKLEIYHQTVIKESRLYCLERLSWCLNRLVTVSAQLENMSDEDSINIPVMYFVNWIDHTFQVLSKLSDFIYKTNYKKSKELYEKWKDDMVDCVSEIYVLIDELLLSAMTLCKYCLPGDQHIVKARCQVVLRETKALLSEIIDGDFSAAIKATPEALKLPIMPSNINVLIDVLKDVLYVLETNTNTALLTLLVDCFSFSKSPVDMLRDHFCNGKKGTCTCLVKSTDDVTEDCLFVKEFDLYNERLLQIGNFALSCSSDQNRILTLRSGLASLEALDPHLVPALIVHRDSTHTQMLMNSWRREVSEIRDSVFLIVDPAAFTEKSKQMMNQKLLTISNDDAYNNSNVCEVINIGCVVHDLFSVYVKNEPQALAQPDKLLALLVDLDKVQLECKIVSNLLSSNEDFLYDVKMTKNNKKVSMDQLVKRLKLLYTLVNRINNLLQPKENDEQLFADDDEDEPQLGHVNTTHTVCRNSDTYVNSPKKTYNITRSIFARTNVRSSTRNIPLAMLTKHIKAKISTELSFSTQLDQLFNAENEDSDKKISKCLDNIRECSVFYKFSPNKNRSSLRKAVLIRHKILGKDAGAKTDFTYDKESIMDEATSLQITDILNQMNDMTSLVPVKDNLEFARPKDIEYLDGKQTRNVLTLNINQQNATTSNRTWNTPVNSTGEMPLDESDLTDMSSITLPSNVTTLQRISDLDLVENKLNSLKTQLETSL